MRDLLSAAVALETQAGNQGLVCHSDPGGGAGVPQVVLVDLPLSGSHHQTSPIKSEVHGGQRTVQTDGPQDNLAGCVIADDLLVQTDTDHQQLSGASFLGADNSLT